MTAPSTDAPEGVVGDHKHGVRVQPLSCSGDGTGEGENSRLAASLELLLLLKLKIAERHQLLHQCNFESVAGPELVHRSNFKNTVAYELPSHNRKR